MALSTQTGEQIRQGQSAALRGSRLLEFNPIPAHRGLTVEAAQMEIAAQAYADAINYGLGSLCSYDGFNVSYVPEVDVSMRHNEVMELAQRWEQA